MFALHAMAPEWHSPFPPARECHRMSSGRRTPIIQPCYCVRPATRGSPFSILPRLAGQQARDRLGERTPEVVQQVIDSAPRARSYYSDALGRAAFSFTRLLLGCSRVVFGGQLPCHRQFVNSELSLINGV